MIEPACSLPGQGPKGAELSLVPQAQVPGIRGPGAFYGPTALGWAMCPSGCSVAWHGPGPWAGQAYSRLSLCSHHNILQGPLAFSLEDPRPMAKLAEEGPHVRMFSYLMIWKPHSVAQINW